MSFVKWVKKYSRYENALLHCAKKAFRFVVVETTNVIIHTFLKSKSLSLTRFVRERSWVGINKPTTRCPLRNQAPCDDDKSEGIDSLFNT